MDVEFTGGPQISLNAEGRMEALLPTSHTASIWREAFSDALPSRQHTGRISATEDAIAIVFDDQRQFSNSMQATIEAMASANRKIRAAEATLRMLAMTDDAESLGSP